MTDNTLSAAAIKAAAAAVGFDACGISAAAPMDPAHAERIRQWVAQGNHASMDYLTKHMDKRLDPRLLMEGAQTIVSVALNYYNEWPEVTDGDAEPIHGEPAANRPMAADGPARYAFARYARGRDYHDVVRERLMAMMQRLDLVPFVDGRPCCDTAPIDERYWAARSGLGWCGRNGQLIIPGAGSYFFLGELVLNRPVDRVDAPIAPRCGTCRRCLDACPTAALAGDGTLDARRCLSFLTIEHRGDLPDGTAHAMGRCVYGCDRCADVCPWNSHARPTAVADFHPSPALTAMTPTDWQTLTIDAYRRLFKGSAVKRAKYDGLMRNIRAVAERE